MIVLCPFCGNKLKEKLNDGITTCDHCGRIFHSSPVTKVLSAAWNVRNWHVDDLETLKRQCELNEDELALVKKHVMDGQLVHDEFFKVVQSRFD